MKPRISKRVREQAAILCSMRATDEASGLPLTLPSVALFGRESARLSWAAFSAVADDDTDPGPGGFFIFEEWWAEAEALLRTGWTPESWR